MQLKISYWTDIFCFVPKLNLHTLFRLTQPLIFVLNWYLLFYFRNWSCVLFFKIGFHPSFKEKIWLYIFSQKMHCIITVTKFCLNIVNLFFLIQKNLIMYIILNKNVLYYDSYYFLSEIFLINFFLIQKNLIMYIILNKNVLYNDSYYFLS